MAKKPTQKVLQMTFDQLVAFGPSGTFAPEAALADLLAAGQCEINDQIVSPAGTVAVRALLAPVLVSEPLANDSVEFVIESDVPMPVIKSGRKSGEMKWPYPFPALKVGQSFFVPLKDGENADEKTKTMKSSVGNANRRFAKATGEVKANRKGKEVPVYVAERKFTGLAVEGGFRVWRTV